MSPGLRGATHSHQTRKNAHRQNRRSVPASPPVVSPAGAASPPCTTLPMQPCTPPTPPPPSPSATENSPDQRARHPPRSASPVECSAPTSPTPAFPESVPPRLQSPRPALHDEWRPSISMARLSVPPPPSMQALSQTPVRPPAVPAPPKCPPMAAMSPQIHVAGTPRPPSFARE